MPSDPRSKPGNTDINEKQRATFYGLDALRGIAAIAVLAFHSREALGVGWLATSGYLAVDLFFVMSGFVIAHAYEARLPSMGVVRFMMARIIRFMPLFYLGGLLGLFRLGLLAVTGHDPDTDLPGAIAYFLFLPAPPSSSAAGSLAPLNGPGWSLLLEIYINLAYALLLPRLNNRLLTAIALVSAIGLLAGMSDHQDLADAHWANGWIAVMRITFSFPVGVLIYRLRGRFAGMQMTTAVPVIVFWLCAFVPASAGWDYLFVLLVSPLVVILGSSVRESSFLARYGASASYCIYAIHLPLISMANGASKVVPLPQPITVAIVIAAILAVAPLVHAWLDVPVRRWLDRTFAACRRS